MSLNSFKYFQESSPKPGRTLYSLIKHRPAFKAKAGKAASKNGLKGYPVSTAVESDYTGDVLSFSQCKANSRSTYAVTDVALDK